MVWKHAGSKWMRGAAGVLSVVLVSLLLNSAARRPPTEFGTITARQIRIVEPDGTLRLIITNRSEAPGIYRKNVEYPREEDPKTAGLFFLNDEGSEVGGLIFGGRKDEHGKVQSHGHLSFDQYAGTQVFAVQGFEEDGIRSSRLRIWDWRDRDGETGKTRLTLGKNADRTVGLTINDRAGRPRILIRVNADDQPELLILNGKGETVSRLVPGAPHQFDHAPTPRRRKVPQE